MQGKKTRTPGHKSSFLLYGELPQTVNPRGSYGVVMATQNQSCKSAFLWFPGLFLQRLDILEQGELIWLNQACCRLPYEVTLLLLWRVEFKFIEYIVLASSILTCVQGVMLG